MTQDVLMKVYQKIDAFRGDAALSSWLFRITFNTAMSRLRKHARRADGRGRRHSDRRPAPTISGAAAHHEPAD